MRWSWFVRGLGLVTMLLVVATACSGSDDDAESAPAGSRPLAFVNVLEQDPVEEIPPSDSYLVELGAPLEEGFLVYDDLGGRSIEVGSITSDPEGRLAKSLEFVELPNGGLLIGTSRAGNDLDSASVLGAVVVDPEARTSVEVYRDEGDSLNWASPRWDPDIDTLKSAGGQCFAWDADTPGSGFTDAACPPLDEQAQPELDRWEAECCDPLRLIDRASGETVYEQAGPNASLSCQQDGDSLLMLAPTAEHATSENPQQMLVLDGGGELHEVGPWTWTDGYDSVDSEAWLQGSAVIYREYVPDGPADQSQRLRRYDIETGETETLLEGRNVGWMVVPGDEPWLFAWQQRGVTYNAPVGLTLWSGDPEAGPLDELADWENREIEDGRIRLDPVTGALYITTRVTGANHEGRISIRLWRVDPGREPVEVARGRNLDISEVAPDGENVVVVNDPEGCDPSDRNNDCWQQVMRLITPTESVELGPGGGIEFLPDGDTFAYTLENGDGGATYRYQVVQRRLSDPTEVEVVYGDGSADEGGSVSLGAVIGAAEPRIVDDPFECPPETCGTIAAQ